MKEVFYIGSFPPPFGGATIKNMVLCNEFTKCFEVSKFDTSRYKNILSMFCKLLWFIFKNRNKKGIICIASKSLFKLTKVICFLDKSILGNISVFILGGIFDTYVSDKKEKAEVYNKYKVIYVESARMKANLERMGFNNVCVIPNFREMPANRKFIKRSDSGKLRCAFISKICEDKGVNVILESDKILRENGIDYSVDFYGHIDKEFEEHFLNSINSSSNLVYKGVIKYQNENSITDVLENYDVLLFPTKHPGEGIPGILVEAKIVGVAPVVSLWNYNDEVVSSGNDGIILESNTPSMLADAIANLINNQKLLDDLRLNSYLSGEKYLISNYIDKIIEAL